MSKSQKILDPKNNEKLIDRQRRLWAHAEAIEIAHHLNKPLPVTVSNWLHRSLKDIAYGADANAVFNVIPEKRGVRRDSFLLESQEKFANGFIAAGTAVTNEGTKLKKTAQAIEEISQALPKTKQATVRKNWNRASTDRKPTFTIGKK